MTHTEAEKILKQIGDQLKKYYLEIFQNRNEVRLLIDENTFKTICAEANNRRPQSYNSFSYEECLEAYDTMGTNPGSNNITLPDGTTSRQVISLAIAVYQVLICYDLSPALSGDNGYYEQLKQNYESLKNAQYNLIGQYFENQDTVWLNVKDLFEHFNKKTNIPAPTQGSGKYVQYPKSQRILEKGILRNIFLRLCEWKDRTEKEVSLTQLKELLLSKDFSDFAQYAQGNFNCDYVHPLIYNAYLNGRNNYISMLKAGEASGDISEGLLPEIIKFDCESRTLFDIYGKAIDFDKAENKFFYYYDDEGCFTNIRKEEDNCKAIGKLIRKEKLSDYASFKDWYFLIDCPLPDYVFIALNTDDLKTNGFNDFLKRFFPQALPLRKKCYSLKYGLLLDARSNTYYKDYPPSIEFDFDCSHVVLKDSVFDLRIDLKSRRLDFSEIGYKISPGRLYVRIPERESDSFYINFVKIYKKSSEEEGELPEGWNLCQMKPSVTEDEDRLVSLKFFPKGNDSESVEETERLVCEKDGREYFVKNSYVDCSYIENSKPFSLSVLKKKEAFLEELINQILNFTDNASHPRAVYEIIFNIARKISDTVIDFEQWMCFYRLLKEHIFESYKERTYGNYMLVLFYGGEKDDNESKMIVRPAYIKKVPYVEGIYDGAVIQNYFSSFSIEGRTFACETKPVKIDVTALPKVLKTLCKNVTFSYEIAAPVPDYLEYLEVVRHLPKILQKDTRDSAGKYSIMFNWAEVPLSTKKERTIIDFSQHVNYLSEEDIERPEGKSNCEERNLFDYNSGLTLAQRMLYKFIQLKGEVSWQEMEGFMKQIPDNEDFWDSSKKNSKLFTLFFPLYSFGLIEVCWTGTCTKYKARKLSLKTAYGRIKTDDGMRLKIYKGKSDFYTDAENEEKVLSILSRIMSIESIIKSWTRDCNDSFDRLGYVWDFSNKGGPWYVPKNNKSFGMQCKSSKWVELAKDRTYFAFSRYELYVMPKRSENPNAERIAKLMQRALEKDKSRMTYSWSKKLFSCRFYDIPLPVLRALIIADPRYIFLPEVYKNTKISQSVDFIITDKIYEELKRIFSQALIKEET